MKNLAARIANRLLDAIWRAWMLIVPLVLALSVVRATQLYYYWPAAFHPPMQDVAAVMFQGMRFDLKVSAVAGFLLLVVFLFVSARTYLRIGVAAAFLFILLSVINLHYFGFYKTPIDAMVFGVAEDDTSAVLKTIWQDLPVVTSVLLCVVLTVLTSLVQRRLVDVDAARSFFQTRGTVFKLGLFLIAFLALLLAGKGTIRQMALQRQHLTVTTSQFLNDMVPNGVIALKYAWDSRHESQQLNDPQVGLKAMGFKSARSAAEVLGLPHDNDEQIAAAMVSHDPLPASAKKRNLIFFLMESWSAEPMMYQAAQFDVLGRMAPTLENACHFSNFDSAQAGTHPSLEAILFSSPITPLTLGPAGRKPIPWAIPQVMKKAGYQTLFLTSGRSGWRDLNRVLQTQGFDEVIDANNLKEMYPEASVGIWGVWDHFLFRYLKKRMAEQPKDKPLFVFVLSTTNHPPFDLPADYQRVKRDMSLWKGETESESLGLNLDTYRYAADLLGDFVQGTLAGVHKDDTVIAATGDHNVRTIGVYAEASRRYLIRQVPFVIWNAQQKCGSQLDKPASHRDMFPTLFPLAGVTGDYVNTGRNLLKTDAKPDDPMNAPRTLFYSAEARNAQGAWILGNPKSFICTSASLKEGSDCTFNALDDQQERARFGLLDWNVRRSLGKQ